MFNDIKKKYGFRKLSVGLASVIIGLSFFSIIDDGTVKADTLTDNDIKQRSTSQQDKKDNSDVKVVKTIVPNESAGSATNVQVNLKPTNVSQNTKNVLVDKTQKSKQVDVVAPVKTDISDVKQTVKVSNESASNNVTPTIKKPVLVQKTSTLTVDKKTPAQFINLVESKASNVDLDTNGGFDEATWGKLDVSKWTGSFYNDYYFLDKYTGDLNHIIVPNAADFVKAGIDLHGKQVALLPGVAHSWFLNGKPKTVAFSKTNGQKVKAYNQDWGGVFSSAYDADHYIIENATSYLTNFDGTNLDVSGVVNFQCMFSLNKLTDISSLANWDVSNGDVFDSMFSSNNISDLSPLANWKFSDLYYKSNSMAMDAMFANNQISDLTPLAHWDVSKFQDMSYVFQNNKISDLSPLAHWDMHNVVVTYGMFDGNQIRDLSPLKDWDLKKDANFGYMFNNNKISDLTPLENWNVSNNQDGSYMFANNQISDVSPLKNWNLSNSTRLGNFFANNQISDVSSLAAWNVGNVRDFRGMFLNNNIKDITPLANWNTSSAVNISNMFYGNNINSADFTKWDFDKVSYYSRFLDTPVQAVIAFKSSQDLSKLVKNSNANESGGDYYPGISAFNLNRLVFNEQNGSITPYELNPLIVVPQGKTPRQALLDIIQENIQIYRNSNKGSIVTPVTPLDKITSLVSLANAQFNVTSAVTQVDFGVGFVGHTLYDSDVPFPDPANVTSI